SIVILLEVFWLKEMPTWNRESGDLLLVHRPFTSHPISSGGKARILLIRFGIVSLLAVALAGSPDPPPKAKTPRYSLTGTVSSVDEKQKSFVVKNMAGKETRLVWTAATTIVGGTLKPGEKATVRYLDKDGKHIATTVSLGERPPAKAPPTAATATPAPAR